MPTETRGIACCTLQGRGGDTKMNQSRTTNFVLSLKAVLREICKRIFGDEDLQIKEEFG